MAVKFEFLSPGVNIREIDNSILPADAIAAGPILIGRSLRGPAMQPIRIKSYEDFVDVFGAPVLGSAGNNVDIWRAGNILGPQYAGVAAQAHLASDTTPITFVRLLGDENPNSPIDTGTKPGWALDGSPSATAASNSTAYGLFLVNSGAATSNNTGSLGAVFYVNSGYMTLSGTVPEVAGLTSSANCLVFSDSDQRGFKAAVYDTSNTLLETISFNFDSTDNSKYIRSQFNTNPVMTNGTLVDSGTKTYWLGETFDRNIKDIVTNTDAGEVYGILMPLESGSVNWSDHQEPYKDARSGWVIAQDQGDAPDFDPIASHTKLFYLQSLHGGKSLQKEVMVGISNISLPIDTSINPFATFNIEIMDLVGNVLEQFTQIDLNPQSDNYIVKKIGNTAVSWSEAERRYTSEGDEPNRSNYFRVVVDDIVRDGAAQGLAPFGFLGPVRPKGFTLLENETKAQFLGSGVSGSEGDNDVAFVKGGHSVPKSAAGGAQDIFALLPFQYSASFKFPEIALRMDGDEGNPPSQYDVYYGVRPFETRAGTRVDAGYVDYVRRLPAGVDPYSVGSLNSVEFSFAFSLDDIVVNPTARTVNYVSGSRKGGISYTATSGSDALLGGNTTDNVDIQQFVMPIWGGFDGLDITEKEPFRNSALTSATTATNSPLYSLFKAIDSIRDSEQVVANSLSIPGLTNTSVTDKVISMCEDRKDLLGIIDIEGGYIPDTEQADRAIGVVTTVISNAKSRRLNTSYACTFYPWVQINANTGVDSGKLWAPPSVAAVGAFASSDRQSDLWFAPAGFNRGGLNPLGGVGGPGVVNVDQTLTAKERDKLYQVNINPIASFPGEGIVVFGQKTLQSTPSALDRINVRRLLIYLKGELSRISRGLLFEPNVNATWLSFKSQADQVLSEVKANFGVTDYKIVLDETTTTPDLIDRNILYAKVFIKPTRAIEYIVVDLIVTNTGAEFV
jgi:phage tail sheath protein FI